MTEAPPVAQSNAMATGAEAERLKRNATMAAVAVATILIAIKFWAWVATDSVAMLASLLDSAVDLLASTVNLIAVRHALTPADREHRFGHGKAEAIAGLGQAAFITMSAMFLFYESISRLITPQRIDESTTGLIVIGVSIALTVALVLYQRHVIRRTRSLAIDADHLHYASDIASNLGVVLALVLAGQFGFAIADPLIGLAIGAVIAWTAFSIVRGAYNELMDREFDDADRQRIKDIVKAHRDVVSMHELRTRRAGHLSFIQLHLELPPGMTLAEAHRISDDVERAIEAAFPDTEVLIHQDPAGIEDRPKKL
jgi:ferrous-iron efflux pump FieF